METYVISSGLVFYLLLLQLPPFISSKYLSAGHLTLPLASPELRAGFSLVWKPCISQLNIAILFHVQTLRMQEFVNKQMVGFGFLEFLPMTPVFL